MADAPALTRDATPLRRGRSGAVAARVAGGRLHFQHGPIDLVIDADGPPEAVRAACESAWQRFDGLLDELVGELAALRRPLREDPQLQGAVARRMVRACLPHADRYVTPMAAVAGAVADEILAAMTAATHELDRAAVNNGGDIALHIARDATWRLGIVADPERATRHGHVPALDGRFEIRAGDPVRGVATSGWRGRSLSLGIADAVTVLAGDAAAADAAATMIANAVNVDHPGIVRARACDVVDDSDLGTLAVTRGVPSLPVADVESALDCGAAHATSLVERGLVFGAALLLQGRSRVIGGLRPRVEGTAQLR